MMECINKQAGEVHTVYLMYIGRSLDKFNNSDLSNTHVRDALYEFKRPRSQKALVQTYRNTRNTIQTHTSTSVHNCFIHLMGFYDNTATIIIVHTQPALLLTVHFTV